MPSYIRCLLSENLVWRYNKEEFIDMLMSSGDDGGTAFDGELIWALRPLEGGESLALRTNNGVVMGYTEVESRTQLASGFRKKWGAEVKYIKRNETDVQRYGDIRLYGASFCGEDKNGRRINVSACLSLLKTKGRDGSPLPKYWTELSCVEDYQSLPIDGLLGPQSVR